MIKTTWSLSRLLRVGLVGWLGGALLACGDNNLFSGLADEDSTQAKQEKAQIALDDGDCQTALALFGELQTTDPSSVARRLDLSAAYLCAAGFDVSAFIDVAASFGAGTVMDTDLFEAIADQTVTSTSATWPADLSEAETLLADDLTSAPPTAFNGNDPDAAFNLAIVQAVKAVLTVTDILNYVNGAVDCAATQGSNAFTNCQITAQNVTDIIDALEDASSLLNNLGVSSEIEDAVGEMVTDLNNIDLNPNNAVTCADLQTYLSNQGFDLTGVSCV
jgi:hypothetical protein